MQNDRPPDLSRSVTETLHAADTLNASVKPVVGLVAILDALGTKLLSLSEAINFIALRDSVMTHTERVVETNLKGLEMERLSKFTFNDTVVYAYCPPKGVTLPEVERFAHLLRVFETRSIVQGTPFRGALAVGEFYIGDKQTILGPAISDAASWYEAADWVGIHATPHASLFIDSLLERALGTDLSHVLFDYDVPMKNNLARQLKAVNWPKGFYVTGLRPEGKGTAKGLVLSALTQRRVPKDTESKYFNALRFFDRVQDAQRLDDRFSAAPSPGPPED
jgi:hypothetical protein